VSVLEVRPSVPITLHPLAAGAIEDHLPALVSLLQEAVSEGASLGFLPPLTTGDGVRYWRSLVGEVGDGSRFLLGAFRSGELVGTAQLALSSWPNARHRAEVQKVVVSTAARGEGIGRVLVEALHRAAQSRGRTLLMLGTRRGEPPERFYRALGYQEVGVIPGYSTGPRGERYDHLVLYYHLD